MSVKRTYKYKLNLNKETTTIMDKTLKTCCWLYNHLLEHFREKDRKGIKQLTKRKLQNLLPKLKGEHPFLKKVQSTILQDVAKRVYKTWQDYRKLKATNPKKKYPNFKPSWRYNSFVYNQPIENRNCGYRVDNTPLSKKVENRKLKLSFGKQDSHYVQILTTIRLSRNLEGDCKTLTIKRKNGRYYACFSCKNVPLRPLPKTGKIGGFDLGIKHLIVNDKGKKIKNPKFYKKSEKMVADIQRILNKKEIKSNNWLKVKLKLAKVWEHLVNQSNHRSHQVANDMVKEYDVIKMEDLNVKGMLEKKLGDNKASLRKSLMGVKFGTLLKVISEKTSIVARRLVLVNPKNTTQKCSGCRELANPKLTLRDRIFECWNCELKLDRDINSARNILNSPATSSIGTCP